MLSRTLFSRSSERANERVSHNLCDLKIAVKHSATSKLEIYGGTHVKYCVNEQFLFEDCEFWMVMFLEAPAMEEARGHFLFHTT